MGTIINHQTDQSDLNDPNQDELGYWDLLAPPGNIRY